MKFRIPKRQADMSGEAFLIFCCRALDSSIPALRTVFLLAGVIAAGLRLGGVGDFLFVTGLLLHFSIRFENWWVQRRPH